MDFSLAEHLPGLIIRTQSVVAQLPFTVAGADGVAR